MVSFAPSRAFFSAPSMSILMKLTGSVITLSTLSKFIGMPVSLLCELRPAFFSKCSVSFLFHAPRLKSESALIPSVFLESFLKFFSSGSKAKMCLYSPPVKCRNSLIVSPSYAPRSTMLSFFESFRMFLYTSSFSLRQAKRYSGFPLTLKFKTSRNVFLDFSSASSE